MRLFESLNLEVYARTVNDPAEARRLVSLAIKGITTDRPGWLRHQLWGTVFAFY